MMPRICLHSLAHRPAWGFMWVAFGWFSMVSLCHAQEPVAQQILGIVSYIEGDYRLAVDERSNVLHEAEYQEQKLLLDQAKSLLPSEADDLAGQFRKLSVLIERKAPPNEVQAQCKDIKAALMQRFAINLAPPPPSEWQHAAQLYRNEGCIACHGVSGQADGPQSASLNPSPSNFRDSEIMQDISPLRAYHAITHGVQGTSMVGFSRLSEADRWALARYIVAWRHSARHAERGKTLVIKEPQALPTEESAVYQSDNELTETIARSLSRPTDQRDVIAYIRRSVEFRQGGPDFSLFRAQLVAGQAAYDARAYAKAKAHFIAAYLEGFEPYEAALSLRVPEQVRRVEKAMLELQQLARVPGNQSKLAQATARLKRMVAGFEHTPSSTGTAFWAALLIALREGVEAVLLIAVLLGMAHKRDEPGLVRWIHGGWLSATALGVLTWFVLGDLLSGTTRELAEGIVALAAAVMLLGVTHWMLGQLTAKRWVGFLMRWWEQSSGSISSRAAIFVLSFVSVYREAFEVVLFFKALALDAAGKTQWVWFGALCGLLALAVVALLLRTLSKRLPIRAFMLVSSAMLALLTVILIGKGVRSLQEAGVIGFTAVSWPELPALGLYASFETLAAQGAMAALIVLLAYWPRWRRRRDTPPIGRTLRET
ncbi:MAG: FTR1 family protein [Myxococcales bacterium]|nr:FTR1 family protein [Myxococcales bacterium]